MSGTLGCGRSALPPSPASGTAVAAEGVGDGASALPAALEPRGNAVRGGRGGKVALELRFGPLGGDSDCDTDKDDGATLGEPVVDLYL